MKNKHIRGIKGEDIEPKKGPPSQTALSKT